MWDIILNKITEYCRNNLALVAVVGACVLLIFVTVIILIAKGASNKKKKKLAAKTAEEARLAAAKKAEEEKAKAEKLAAEKAEAEKIAKQKAEEEARLAAEKAEADRIAAQREEAKRIAAERQAEEERLEAERLEAERIAAEKAEAERLEAERIAAEKAEKKAAAEKARKAKAAEKAAAEKVAAEMAATEKPATKTTAKPVAKSATKSAAKASPTKAKPVEKTVEKPVEDEGNAEDTKYKGKWTICRIVVEGKEDEVEEESYFFELHASNGEKLLSSEEYTSYAGALSGINTHKANIERNNFKITLSKKGDYIFKLLSGKNTLLCMGENYSTRARCESAIESTKRFAATAIIDENVVDQVVKTPVEDDGEAIEYSIGSYNGKWIISAMPNIDGNNSFYFELFANNGEKLLSSEEYTTYTGAVNGIATHKTNIQKGNFRISLTKRGDYIYKLFSGNGQLLCLGEHYKTKRLCQNAIESVKRFALNSPVLTESEIAHENM